MSLYEVENVGDWAEDDFVNALVVAPNTSRAVALVAHLTRNIDPRDLRVSKVSTTGEQLLSTQFNDEQ